jgi:glycosyltransferase involved in cell wall biosynthesis
LKTLFQDNRMVTKRAITQQHTPFKVCMHVRGVVRTDGRVLRAAIALIEAGFTVTILDIEDDLTRSVEEDISGIHVKHIMKPGWLKLVRFVPLRLIRSTQKLIYTTLQLIRMPADVYHAHDDNALAACYIAALWHRKPLIFDAHEFPLIALKDKHWLSVLLTRLFTPMVRRCAGIITVSSPIAQEICDLYHVPHVSVIRNLPVYQAPPKSDRLQQYLGLNSNVRIALYQGNMDPARGLDKLVRAAKFLEPDIVIVMMGKGVGITPSQLHSLIISEEVSDRIKILPPVPYAELLDWTASADIGLTVLPPDYSLSIGMCLPNKLFEYLMAGLPVLSSQLPAVAEVINTYDVGCILSSLEPKDIGAAINAMLANHNALARMHYNALNAAKHDLCWEKESRHLVRLYMKILVRHEEETSDLHSAITI